MMAAAAAARHDPELLKRMPYQGIAWMTKTPAETSDDQP